MCIRDRFAAIRYRVWGCGIAQMRAVTYVQGRDGVGRLDLQWRRTSGVDDEMCPRCSRSDVGVFVIVPGYEPLFSRGKHAEAGVLFDEAISMDRPHGALTT